MATQLIIVHFTVQAMDILFVQKFSSLSDVNEGVLSEACNTKTKTMIEASAQRHGGALMDSICTDGQ